MENKEFLTKEWLTKTFAEYERTVAIDETLDRYVSGQFHAFSEGRNNYRLFFMKLIHSEIEEHKQKFDADGVEHDFIILQYLLTRLKIKAL